MNLLLDVFIGAGCGYVAVSMTYRVMLWRQDRAVARIVREYHAEAGTIRDLVRRNRAKQLGELHHRLIERELTEHAAIHRQPIYQPKAP